MQSAFYRSYRNTEVSCGFRCGQLLDITQDQYLPVVQRQSSQCRHKIISQLKRNGHLLQCFLMNIRKQYGPPEEGKQSKALTLDDAEHPGRKG